jgi:hypothetical protein
MRSVIARAATVTALVLSGAACSEPTVTGADTSPGALSIHVSIIDGRLPTASADATWAVVQFRTPDGKLVKFVHGEDVVWQAWFNQDLVPMPWSEGAQWLGPDRQPNREAGVGYAVQIPLDQPTGVLPLVFSYRRPGRSDLSFQVYSQSESPQNLAVNDVHRGDKGSEGFKLDCPSEPARNLTLVYESARPVTVVGGVMINGQSVVVGDQRSESGDLGAATYTMAWPNPNVTIDQLGVIWLARRSEAPVDTSRYAPDFLALTVAHTSWQSAVAIFKSCTTP